MSRWGLLALGWLALFGVACAAGETASIDDDDDRTSLDPDGSVADSGAGRSDAGGDGSSQDDACTNVVCDKPPANECADGNTVRIYEGDGACREGSCEYPSTTVACPFGCKNGACQANPCEGVICNLPPANSCVDATTLRVYATVGTCGTSGCTYESELVSCPHGCAEGKCKDDPCVGVTCNTPPDNKCASSSYLTANQSPGTCSNGTCVYASESVYCKFGCENGVCNGDPCIGTVCDTPPANYCQDEFKLVVHEAPGTCSGGVCS